MGRRPSGTATRPNESSRSSTHTFTEHGLTADEFLSREYLRLTQIKKLQAAERLDDTLRWVAPAQ